ncbi:hypothetical protein [Mycobacterium sp. 852002-30065_SCH5024008]|uniref:hypothetical protein n=1 Tax=Mycobacterium sp. 852002-30065_SCH5024008 TaxID=1834088 RepID=UPI0007FFA296|nr:hypothetical protein [Mycobacterium sp. 852002-30065_SCH5024008]OBB84547.1 hypothetical protein A5781_07775 [Mycobacterium sp. 852002-30065_SCH5024008]
MAACRLQCWECGTAFYGRADAHYCSGACRQKSHRASARRRAAEETVPMQGMADAIARAREARESARVVCERSRAAREALAVAAVARSSAGDEPAPRRRSTPE